MKICPRKRKYISLIGKEDIEILVELLEEREWRYYEYFRAKDPFQGFSTKITCKTCRVEEVLRYCDTASEKIKHNDGCKYKEMLDKLRKIIS